jgi:hypothetical protein
LEILRWIFRTQIQLSLDFTRVFFGLRIGNLQNESRFYANILRSLRSRKIETRLYNSLYTLESKNILQHQKNPTNPLTYYFLFATSNFTLSKKIYAFCIFSLSFVFPFLAFTLRPFCRPWRAFNRTGWSSKQTTKIHRWMLECADSFLSRIDSFLVWKFLHFF